MNLGHNHKRKRYARVMWLNYIVLACVMLLAAFLLLRAPRATPESPESLDATVSSIPSSAGPSSEPQALVSLAATSSSESSSSSPSSTSSSSEGSSSSTEENSFKPAYPIKSESVLLIDLNTNKTLFEKNSTKKMYPASLTKIMSTIVALEHAPPFDETVTIEYEDYIGLFEQNASLAGFAVGETITVGELVYAVMLPSGAEAAAALARITLGSEADLVAAMNKKAEELEMNDTHFVNVSGLHDPEHVSTAVDMAKLLTYALKNKDFAKSYSTFEYTCTPTTQHPQGLKLVSTLKRMQDIYGVKQQYITGAKTGFTNEAQYCLSSICEQDGQRLLLITLKAPEVEEKFPDSITDSMEIYKEYLLFASKAS